MQMTKTTAAAAASTTSTQSASSSASLVSSVNASPSASVALPTSVSPVPTLLPSVTTGGEKEPGTKLNDGKEIPEANSLDDVFVPLETIRPGEIMTSSSYGLLFDSRKENHVAADISVFAVIYVELLAHLNMSRVFWSMACGGVVVRLPCNQGIAGSNLNFDFG